MALRHTRTDRLLSSILETPHPLRAAFASLPVLGLAFEAYKLDDLCLAVLRDRFDKRPGMGDDEDLAVPGCPGDQLRQGGDEIGVEAGFRLVEDEQRWGFGGRQGGAEAEETQGSIG